MDLVSVLAKEIMKGSVIVIFIATIEVIVESATIARGTEMVAPTITIMVAAMVGGAPKRNIGVRMPFQGMDIMLRHHRTCRFHHQRTGISKYVVL